MLVKVFHELTELCFSDDQVLYHRYTIPDAQYTDKEK